MAAATDKARFYMEQTVPELRELERKKIFSNEEIVAITKKRNDFEHKLTGRGTSTPADYARYAEYEMNLDALRQKRVKRLGAKSSGHKAKQRIFFILDRATRKFYADMGLWLQYIEFARKEKAYRRLEAIFTSALRLHPTRPELWIYAARYAMDDQADMMAARGYMQRGLRFCKKSKVIWLEYAKLEMLYIAKIAARRQVLGLVEEKRAPTESEDDPDTDVITLPAITGEDLDMGEPEATALDETAMGNLANSPALTGAIPIAIFDAAMKEFGRDNSLAEEFFDMFLQFDHIKSLRNILEHVQQFLQETSPESIANVVCTIKFSLLGVNTSSPDFPSSLGASLRRMKKASEDKPRDTGALAERVIPWLVGLLDSDDIDTAIRRVIVATIKQQCIALSELSRTRLEPSAIIADIAVKLRKQGRLEDGTRLAEIGSHLWPPAQALVEKTEVS